MAGKSPEPLEEALRVDASRRYPNLATDHDKNESWGAEA